MNKSIATLGLALTMIAAPASAQEVWITMDYVEPYKLKAEASKIIVGNPGIADIQVQDPSNVLLFAKSPGTTNVFVLDESGERIQNIVVRVRALSDNVLTIQRGSLRTTYNCMSVCEETVTIGDNQETFGRVSTQIQQKFQQAAVGNEGN
ncbi:MAG: pilus assembly protein N-terminal domain-containing protein [Pseudomonadota bacterium]